MSEIRLPKAIQNQLDQASALEAQMRDAQPGTVTVESLANPQPEPVVVAEPPQVPREPTPAEPPKEDYEHKFKTLQGMFRAEVNNQVSQQLQQSRQREDELLRSVQQLQRNVQELKEVKPAAPMDPKDVEAFGQELVEMARRQATQVIEVEISKALGSVLARLDTLEQQTSGVSRTVAASVEQTFYSELSRLVPDWKTINSDQGFLTWLGTPDPVYGEPRQAAMDRAAGAYNAERAAAIFAAFKQSLPAPAVPPARSELESQVAPDRSGSQATQVVQERKVNLIAQRDIIKFFDDLRRGVYRGREADAAAIENGINQAIAEGRVV